MEGIEVRINICLSGLSPNIPSMEMYGTSAIGVFLAQVLSFTTKANFSTGNGAYDYLTEQNAITT